ncbi:MAG: hypothetical protein J5742_01520 [Alphaproteobacteria bacterium]|nr:hypothetical protein [Alphaproteobacteria bacterium]
MDTFTSKEEYMLYNEYIIADKKYPNQSTQQITLVPTLDYEPKTLTFKGSHNWTPLSIGDLVWLSRKGTIKPVKYDMRKCDIMLVIGEDVFDNNSVKQLRVMGKKFGLQTLDLANDIECAWQWKFYPTKLNHTVLVRPDVGPDNKNNDYKILRNFTIEKQIAEFFNSQRQH